MSKATALANFAAANAAGSSFGFKNRIINGDMRIDQRNAGAAITSTVAGTYSVDRFTSYANGGGAYTTQRSTDVPAGQGFAFSLLHTVTTPSTPTSLAYYLFVQMIEGLNIIDLAWGTSGAQSVALSFWVKSSVTGTYTVSLRNSGFSRTYRATYTVNAANTWEKKTITVPGDTAGTWLIDSGVGIRVGFAVGAGSNYIDEPNVWSANDRFAATGQTQWISTNGATFQVTGVQLEEGPTATSFDFRSIGQELALCQRYCQRVASFNGEGVGTGVFYNANDFRCTVTLKQVMRAAPTLSQVTGTGFFTIYYSGSATTVTALSLDGSSQTTVIELQATTAAGVAGYAGLLRATGTPANITLSAEL